MLPISNEKVTTFHHGNIGRPTEMVRSGAEFECFAHRQRWPRQIGRFEHQHLMHADISHPVVALVIDGQSMRHVKHLRAPPRLHLASSSVDMNDHIVVDRSVLIVQKSIVVREISVESPR